MGPMKAASGLGAILLGVVLTSCGSGYQRSATVTKIAMINPPDNLSDASECRVLWNDISRFGIEMDKASKEWNQIILNTAGLLIEKGCVKRVHSE